MQYRKMELMPFHELCHRCSIFLLLGVLSVFLAPKTVLSDDKTIAPNQRYSPQQVITIVVDSLQNNTDDDEGIATVFRFASPLNKASTGPLLRFTQMIKRGFPDMLNHTGVSYDAMEIADDTAVQAVWLQNQSGAEFGYAFQLRKQSGGAHDGMWMTEAVIPLGKKKNSGIRI